MISALDCAVLAEDVYNRVDNNLAQSHGWRRLDGQNWADGFAAGVYEKNNQRVVAFRGTDDFADAISDARMVPSASLARVASVTPRVLNEYGLSDRVELVVGAVMLSQILNHRYTRRAIRVLANQTPPEQTRLATAYRRSISPGPDFVTGHSLGGALAKTISLREGIPCVAFNSPFMGDLRGVPPVSSEQVTSINARLDPLSLATGQVGNLSHGRNIYVHTPSYLGLPPSVPRVDSYRRPVACPRASGNWWTSEEGIYAAALGPVCEAALDMWEPIGRITTATQRNFHYWFRQRPQYVAALLHYLGDVAIHFHSMENLRVAMQGMPQFQNALYL